MVEISWGTISELETLLGEGWLAGIVLVETVLGEILSVEILSVETYLDKTSWAQ